MQAKDESHPLTTLGYLEGKFNVSQPRQSVLGTTLVKKKIITGEIDKSQEEIGRNIKQQVK